MAFASRSDPAGGTGPARRGNPSCSEPGPEPGETNLTAPSQVAELLRRHHLRPKKSLGQNFLIDQNALERIVEAAELSGEDGVLEIGSGIGTLTRALAPRCRAVVSLELDSSLLPALRESVGDRGNVMLVQADALRIDLGEILDTLGPGPAKVVANIPYYITSPLLERLLAQRGRLERIVLLVQKEVAERLTARPGTGDYGSLSVFAQLYAEIDIVGTLSRRAFLPSPKVDSAILRLKLRERLPVPVTSEEAFLRVVHAAFQQRRKTLPNSLASFPALGLSRAQAAEALERAGIAPRRRGETLGLEEFSRLEREIARLDPAPRADAPDGPAAGPDGSRPASDGR